MEKSKNTIAVSTSNKDANLHATEEELSKIALKLYDKVFSKLHKDLKSNKKLREKMILLIIEKFLILKFNQYQAALTVYYMDLFFEKLRKKLVLDFHAIKTVFLVSIAASYKMTCDKIYRNKDLALILNAKNLDELERLYYEEVGFQLFPDFEIVKDYLKLLS